MEYASPNLRTVHATRYVTPLREGGSLPAIVEAGELGTHGLSVRGGGGGGRASRGGGGGAVPGDRRAGDLGAYVLKFRGAGQGRKALIAELVAGGIGRALGLGGPGAGLVRVHPGPRRAAPGPAS